MEYKMNQEFILNMTTIGGGFLIGMLTGYFLRKVLRLVMFALGGVFSLAMYLQYQGLITINLDKIQNYIDKIASTYLTQSPLSQAEDQFNIVPLSICNMAIPFTGSMAVSITTGFLRG
jgi:uncharacterized membrane protein (Fun14 family)